MEDRIAELSSQGKLTRVSTYRMAQAISNIIAGLSDGEKNIDTYVKPDNLILRAVRYGEVRIIDRAGAVDVAKNHR